MAGYRRRHGPSPLFWAAVFGIAYLAPVVGNVVVDRLGPNCPKGLQTLNAYATRKNG